MAADCTPIRKIQDICLDLVLQGIEVLLHQIASLVEFIDLLRRLIEVREKEDAAGAFLLFPGYLLRDRALSESLEEGLPLLESQILILEEVEGPVPDLPPSPPDQALVVQEPVVEVDPGCIVDTVTTEREEVRALTADDPLDHLSGDEPAIQDQDGIRKVQTIHGGEERRDILHRPREGAQHHRQPRFSPGEESEVHLGKGDLLGIVAPLGKREVIGEGEDKGEIVDEMAVAGAEVLEDQILTDAVIANGSERGREGFGGTVGLDVQGVVQFLPGGPHPFEGEISGDSGEDESNNLLPMVGECFGENRDEILKLQSEEVSVTVFVYGNEAVAGQS